MRAGGKARKVDPRQFDLFAARAEVVDPTPSASNQNEPKPAAENHYEAEVLGRISQMLSHRWKEAVHPSQPRSI